MLLIERKIDHLLKPMYVFQTQEALEEDISGRSTAGQLCNFNSDPKDLLPIVLNIECHSLSFASTVGNVPNNTCSVSGEFLVSTTGCCDVNNNLSITFQSLV